MLDRRTLIALLTAAPFTQSAFAAANPTLRLVNGTRIFVDAAVNGHVVDALLDSGAELTILDARFAQFIGIGGGQSVTARGTGAGTAEATLVKGVTLAAAGLSLAKQTVAIMDLSDIGARLIGRPVDCILGREIFDAARLTIDIAGGRFAVASRGRPPGVRLPLTTDRGNELLPIRIEDGAAVWATFDLGNGSDMLIGAAYAERAGLLSAGRQLGMRKGGGIGGEVARQTLILSSVEIAGRRFANVPAAIDASAHAADANIGVSLLRSFLITADFAKHAIWLAAY